MIVVLGRPRLRERATGADPRVPRNLAGLTAGIALSAAAAGSRVEVVGSVADDGDGDALTLALGRAGVGHAAVLRAPVGDDDGSGSARADRSSLDAGDVELGLRYLADHDVRVVVLAEPLSPETERAAVEAAAYHGAAVVAVVPVGAGTGHALAAVATVLEAPADAGMPFAELVGRYAAGLDQGEDAATALRAAVRETGSQAEAL